MYIQFVFHPDSPEEGEIRPPKRPKLPHGPPPPEEEWAPALRMVVTSSDVLPEQTLFVVTQEGASIGRCVRVCMCVCVCACVYMCVYVSCCL